jgi:hypothetical protein
MMLTKGRSLDRPFCEGVARLFPQQEEAEKSRVVADPRLQPLKLQNKSVIANRGHRSGTEITIALWLQR